MKPQFLIGSIVNGSGKTLFAMGMLRALKKRGYKVQPYKNGTDFMDAQLLSLAADTETVHLDTWMASHTHVQHLYNKYGEKADICLTEGMAGLFDGYRKMHGSSAEMAKLLNVPVILLVNARMMGYSVAPLIYGFRHFYPEIKIIGVIFNQVSSSAHFTFLKEACADAGIDCLGYLPWSDECKLPSKHTGLTLTVRKELDRQIDKLSEVIERNIDIDRLLSNASRDFPCRYVLPYSSETEIDTYLSPLRKIKIAVARDAAFCFAYRENIDYLKRIGDVTYFSPVYGSDLPEADFIYFPGGFPELFARQLHRRKKLMESLKDYAERGGRILAEGGGVVFLSHSLRVRQGGTSYLMSQIFPFDFSIPNNKLHSKCRRQIYHNMELKGNEYHCFQLDNEDVLKESIYRYKNVIASFFHLYWGEDIFKLWD